METRKKRFKDRKDGYYVYDLDSMHKFMPYLLPNRADNEAVLKARFDMTKAMEYLAVKNSVPSEDGFKYTIFHLFLAAVAKTVYLRPLLNRFIQGRRVYDRKFMSFCFIVKKKFCDGSNEAVAIMKLGEDKSLSPIEEVHDKIHDIVYDIRVNNKTDSTTGVLDKLTKLPRFLLKFVTWCLMTMDYLGIMPTSLMKDDPYYTTVFLTNLGSIKMDADYHHLANYGTNSIFAIVGEMKKRPFFNDDGTYEMKQSVDLGLTIDERIADGVYFAKSIKVLQKIIENPELLDRPYDEEVEVGDVCGKPAFSDLSKAE
ncbi:MAG: 2-oxo acid dehydrogenase subunit E2 [Clostridia bacterium]|nr:2-oxo acid dehydrogenase subunit E2 [Clostridia bacterium]